MSGRHHVGHPHFDAHDDLLDAPVDGTLDLHGYGAIEAPSAVRNFVATWRRRKPGAVLHIVTGKGKRSADGPVLRGLVRTLLHGELRKAVADSSPDVAEGGYILRVR